MEKLLNEFVIHRPIGVDADIAKVASMCNPNVVVPRHASIGRVQIQPISGQILPQTGHPDANPRVRRISANQGRLPFGWLG